MKRNKKKCQSNKRKLITMYGRFCMSCGKKLTKQETTYHHITPLSEDGNNEIDNGSILGEECCHKFLHEVPYDSWSYQVTTKRILWFKENCKKREG